MFSRLIRGWGNQPEKQFPALTGMLRVFLSCHHDDFGNTIEEMLKSYIDHQMPVADVRKEISALLQIKGDSDLNVMMAGIAGDEFRPEPWGETWRGFLNGVLTTLDSEH